jgi:hypothetical protein
MTQMSPETKTAAEILPEQLMAKGCPACGAMARGDTIKIEADDHEYASNHIARHLECGEGFKKSCPDGWDSPFSIPRHPPHFCCQAASSGC